MNTNRATKEHYQSNKQFGSRSGQTFCQFWSGSKLFAKIRQQNLLLGGKVLKLFYTVACFLNSNMILTMF